jgi:RNA polymerase sigma factor (sigma-70 family)
VARLPDTQRDVLVLRYSELLPYHEIAEVLAVSERTVKRDWRMARAWLYGELSQ